MTLIIVALGVTALYSIAMWLFIAISAMFNPDRDLFTRGEHDSIELATFHLGLCAILALGFIGLLIK